MKIHSNEITRARVCSFLDIDKDVLWEFLVYLKDVRKVVYKTQKSYFSALSSARQTQCTKIISVKSRTG